MESLTRNDYGGFWRRFLASCLDGLIFFIAAYDLDFLFFPFTSCEGNYREIGHLLFCWGLVLSVWWACAALVYWVLMESSIYQATLGKMALGLVVTDLEGNRISISRSIGRSLAQLLSILTFGIGYIMIGFMKKKQGLHNLVAGCLVVKKSALARITPTANAPAFPPPPSKKLVTALIALVFLSGVVFHVIHYRQRSMLAVAKPEPPKPQAAQSVVSTPLPAVQVPESAEFYWKRGIEYFKKGQWDLATSDFHKSAKIDWKFGISYHPGSASYDQAKKYDDQGQWDKSLEYINKCLELEPDNPGAYALRARIYSEKRQYDQAIADANMCLEILNLMFQCGGTLMKVRPTWWVWPMVNAGVNPTFASVYFFRGWVYAQKGQYDRAIDDYTMALEISPKHTTMAYEARAKGYFYKNNYDQAWNDVHKAESLGGKLDPEFLQGLRKASGRNN